MTTQTTEKQTVNISAHISQSLADKLEKVARYEERAKSYYIKKSLEQYLEQRLEDIQDYKEAKESWEEMEISGREGTDWENVKLEMRELEKKGV
jgi:predicted DNA-binding protein